MTSWKWSFWNNGICQDILKEQCPWGLLAKNEHFGANCVWYVSRLYSENSIQTLLFFGGAGGWGGGLTRKNLEGFVWSFLRITGLWSQRRFAPKCSFLASRPLGHCYFRISWQIPWFQKFHFYDVTLKYSIARFRWGSSSHVEEMGLLFEK